MSRFSTRNSSVRSTVGTHRLFRSKRVVGATAAVAGGALLAVPALVGGASAGAAPAALMAKDTAPRTLSAPVEASRTGHEIVQAPREQLVLPTAGAGLAAKAKAAAATTATKAPRASRSQTRPALPRTSGPTSAYSGSSPKAVAQSMLASRGWSGQ